MESIDPTESIKIIESALNRAKAEKTGAAFYYLLWGALLFIHFFLVYLFLHYTSVNGLQTLAYIVFPLGGLISYLKSKKDDRSEKALSYYEKVYLYCFSAFALAYGTIFLASFFIISRLLFVSLYPLLLGFAVFVSGGITRYKPSLLCGAAGIVITGFSLNAPIQIQYLLAALSSVVICIIPGYFMKNNNV